jgi:hypothetical protein
MMELDRREQNLCPVAASLQAKSTVAQMSDDDFSSTPIKCGLSMMPL